MIANVYYTEKELWNKIDEIKTLRIGDVEVCGRGSTKIVNIYQTERDLLVITLTFEQVYDEWWFKSFKFTDMVYCFDDVIDLMYVLGAGYNDYHRLTIDDVGFSIRTQNCLEKAFGKHASMNTICRYGERRLLKIPNFGVKTLEEIKEKMKFNGLEFRK